MKFAEWRPNRPSRPSLWSTSSGPGGISICRSEIDAASHDRRAAHYQPQDVFDTSVLGEDIQRDGLSLSAGQVHHTALTNKLRAQEGCIDGIENRVPIRSVHDRVESGLQVNRIATGFQAEIGGIRFSIYGDVLEHAAILAF